MKPRSSTALTPLRVATEAELLARIGDLPRGTDERALPLAMRGGLPGVYGFGPNPAREHLNREGKTDEQR